MIAETHPTFPRSGRGLLLTGIVCGVVGIGLSFAGYGYDETWRLWRVPTMAPAFADTRTITHAAESHVQGVDVRAANPADPWGRSFNYPAVWLSLGRLGLDSSHTVPLAVAFIASFLGASFLYTSRDLDRTTAAVLLVSIFSPAAMLGFERGNSDLLIYSLLASAIFLAGRPGVGSRFGALGLTALAFVLKLFPVFGFAYLLRERRTRWIRIGLGLGLLVALYTAVNFEELKLIRSETPRSTDHSYGIDVGWMNAMQRNAEVGRIVRGGAYLMAISWLGLAAWRGLRGSPLVSTAGRTLDAFRVGAAIYVGTFVLGNNFDYRLIFLMFTIPKLIEWVRQPVGRDRWIAGATLLAIVISMWRIGSFLGQGRAGTELALGLDELANWAVFAGLAHLFAVSSGPFIGRRDSDQMDHRRRASA